MEDSLHHFQECIENFKVTLEKFGIQNYILVKKESIEDESKSFKYNRRAFSYEVNEEGVSLTSDDDDSSETLEYFESDFSDNDDSIDENTYSNKKRTFLKAVFKLPLYPPSENIEIANDSNFSTKSLYENHSEIIQNFLTDSKLNKDNIHIVYKMLLEMEDITNMSEYITLAHNNVTINSTKSPRVYWISLKDCPNIDDIVTPLIDEVIFLPKATCKISEKYKADLLLHRMEVDDDRLATVRKISKDRVYFHLSKKNRLSAAQLNALLTTKHDIIFRSRRYPLRYQHNAIELLSISPNIREYLFPTDNPNKELISQRELNLLNLTIASNPEQLDAVKYIAEGLNSNAPFVIFGPPGTGKTTVTVESILQLRINNPENRILVTGGSNTACDTIALRLCKYLKGSHRLKQLQIKYPVLQKPIIRIYSKSGIQKGTQLIDSELLEYSNSRSGVHYYPSVKEIHQYGIVVATLCTVGKLVTCDVGKLNFFTHIFMDEVGASTVPEALVGIMGIKRDSDCHLILSGDHKQLGPILKSERAAQLGLEQSLIERLLSCNCYAVDDNFNYDHTLQARLRRNYRSHPEIVRLYNHLYYNDELIAEAKEEDVCLAAKWCKLPNSKFPIIFQAVHGITEKDSRSPSSFNNLEIQVVLWFLQRLLVDGIDGQRVNQTDIGIITPYKLQINHIQNRLKKRGWHKVECGSVETFQGREKQVIIVSLVKSFAGLGFLNNPKRLNVLLSRPKSLLIIIGNPLTLSRHSDFEFIIDECKRNGTFLRKKKNHKHKS